MRSRPTSARNGARSAEKVRVASARSSALRATTTRTAPPPSGGGKNYATLDREEWCSSRTGDAVLMQRAIRQRIGGER
jgi:hypothetical protein